MVMLCFANAVCLTNDTSAGTKMSCTVETMAQNQCRLCLSYASEFCRLANRLEDMRTVQEVIKMLLSIEDDPGLPQQICASCSKELLHMARLKDCWVANQFTLARQATSLVYNKNENQRTDIVQFQADDQAEEEMYLEVDENVSDSELFLAKAELGEFSIEEPANETNQMETNKGHIENGGAKKKYKYVKKCGEYKFRCYKCHLSFPTLKLKNEHVRLHNKCEICGATFMMKNDLRRHMRKHNGERPYSCPHCYQTFSRTNHVKDHIKKWHESVKTHACLLCTKNFTDRAELIQHKQKAHSITRRTQRQKATIEERLPSQRDYVRGTIPGCDRNLHMTLVVKEEQVDDDYELIID